MNYSSYCQLSENFHYQSNTLIDLESIFISLIGLPKIQLRQIVNLVVTSIHQLHVRQQVVPRHIYLSNQTISAWLTSFHQLTLPQSILIWNVSDVKIKQQILSSRSPMKCVNLLVLRFSTSHPYKNQSFVELFQLGETSPIIHKF